MIDGLYRVIGLVRNRFGLALPFPIGLRHPHWDDLSAGCAPAHLDRGTARGRGQRGTDPGFRRGILRSSKFGDGRHNAPWNDCFWEYSFSLWTDLKR